MSVATHQIRMKVVHIDMYNMYVHINSFGNQGTTQLIVPDVFIVVGIPS